MYTRKKNGEHFCVVYNTFVSVYGSSGFVISRFGSRVCGKEISAPIESGIFLTSSRLHTNKQNPLIDLHILLGLSFFASYLSRFYTLICLVFR